MPTFTEYKKGSADGGTADTDTRFSPSIWGNAPDLQGVHDGGAYLFYDDFLSGFITTHNWIETSATTGTIATIIGEGGILLFDAAASTADQGQQAQGAMSTVSGSFLPKAGTKIWFECRLAIGDTPSNQFFCGLATQDTTVFATGANSTADHIGFEMNALTIAGTVGTAGTANFYGEKAGTRNTASANVGLDVHAFTDGGTGGATLFTTSGAFVKLGFIVDGVTDCTVYVNGQKTGDVITTDNIPVLGLVPTLLIQSEGTTDPTMQVDWLKVLQTRT